MRFVLLSQKIGAEQMELPNIISTVLASILAIVLAHIGAYFVIKSLYPPAPVPVPVAPVFTQPPVTEQQNVTLPTYETPLPTEAPREEGERRGPPPPESTSIHGNSGVVVSNTQ